MALITSHPGSLLPGWHRAGPAVEEVEARMARGGGRSPFQVSLRAGERRALKRSARSQAAPHRQVVRARIVLDAAAGLPSALIARRVGVAPNTVRKWRKRFSQEGYAGLRDRKRPGRPRVFAAAVVAEVKAIACELPVTRGVPIGRWSLAELREEVIASGLLAGVSTATVGRWLAEDAIRPWQPLAAPFLDLPPRSRVRRQGRPGARPVRRDVPGRAAGRGRVRHLSR
jgi:transposase